MFEYLIAAGVFRSGAVPNPPAMAPEARSPSSWNEPGVPQKRLPMNWLPLIGPYACSKAFSDGISPDPPTAQK